MRILVVTGRLAEKEVRRSSGDRADVLVVDEDIAAFITPGKLKKYLHVITGYDIVLVPGLAKGNFAELEKETGVKIRLGPIHAVDLGYILDEIENIELSHSVPACKLIKKKMGENTIRKFDEIRGKSGEFFRIGDVSLKEAPPVIIAEIVNAIELEKENLISHARYLTSCGADIIDVGASLEAEPEDAGSVVKTLVKEGFTVSIDSHNPDVIGEALRNGASLVLSITEKNIDSVGEIVRREASAVLVSIRRDVKELASLVKKVKGMGLNRIIADPVLDPPMMGFSESIERYVLFRREFPDIPLLMGAGNVTELIDADSPGINAILASMAVEIGVSAILTTEFSHKVKGTVRELKKGIIMATVAKYRKTPPKDLGVDLLILKEKSRRPAGRLPESYIQAEPTTRFVRDPAGDFRIWITEKEIVASHPEMTIVGKDAKSIIDTIIASGLVSRLDHAGYLGRELMKAEIALRLGRSYLQDDDF